MQLGNGDYGNRFSFSRTLTVNSTNLAVIFGLSLLGVGMGFFQTPNNNLLMTAVPRQRLGVGSAFLSIVRSVGYSIGAMLATTIVSIYLLESTGQTSLENLRGAQAFDADNPVLSAFLRGYRCTYLVAATIAFAGAVISLIPMSNDRRQDSLV